MSECPWCAHPYSDVVPDPELLCRHHLAEYEGLPLSELNRMDDEQAAEYHDARPWWM